MSWVKSHIELGNVKQKSKNILYYEYTGNLKIVNVARGCTKCTVVKGFKDNILEVVYTPNYIPIHLRVNPGYQNSRKTLVVTYEDGSKDTLSFSARIVK